MNTFWPSGTASAARIASSLVQVLPLTVVVRATNASEAIAPYSPPAATSSASAAPARTGVRIPADARLTGFVRRTPPPGRAPGRSADGFGARTADPIGLRELGLRPTIVSAAGRRR